MGFNPSTGLSVFQTGGCVIWSTLQAESFQSLDWVERLSDENPSMVTKNEAMFQSLDWVERLSDTASRALHLACFNPSTGLSVFQTGRRWSQLVLDAGVSIPRLG